MQSFIQQSTDDGTLKLHHNYLLGHSVDQSIHGNDGVDTDVEYSDDGALFPLNTSKITVPDSLSIQLTTGTIVAFFSTGISSQTTTERIVSKKDGGGTNYELGLTGSGTYFLTSGGSLFLGGSVLTDHFLAVNFGDTEIPEGFSEGESSGDYNGTSAMVVDDAALIVGNQAAGSSQLISGLSKLLIFSRKLTPMEHYLLYAELAWDIFSDPTPIQTLYEFQLTATADSVGAKNNVSFYAPPSILGAELLTDVGMDAATAGDWSAGNSGTLSKETTSPFSGLRNLKVTRNGVNDPYAYEAVLTEGEWYHAKGRVRSDGNAIPEVGTDTTKFWTAETANSEWVDADLTFLADSANMAFQATTSTGTEYCEFDGWTVKKITGVVEDGDMKRTDFTLWTLYNNPTSTKETGTPHSGTRNAKLLYNGTSNPGMRKVCLTSGYQFRIQFWARVNSCTFQLKAGTAVVWSTTSTTWDKCDLIVTADSDTLDLGSTLCTGAGDYIEIDDVTVEPYPWDGSLKLNWKQFEYSLEPTDSLARVIVSDICNPYGTEELWEYEEDNLVPGQLYYYSIFARNNLGAWGNNPFLDRASAYPYKRWGFSSYMFKSLPSGWITADVDTGGDLEAFLNIFGALFDNMKTDCEYLLTLFDVNEIHDDFIQFLDRKIGWPTWFAAGGLQRRIETLAAVALYKDGVGRASVIETAVESTINWTARVVEGWRYVFFSNGLYGSTTPDLSAQADIDEILEKRGTRDDILKYSNDNDGWHSVAGLGLFMEYIDGTSDDMTNTTLLRVEELVEEYLKVGYATVEFFLEPDST